MKPIPKAELERWTMPRYLAEWRMGMTWFCARSISNAIHDELEIWQPDLFDTLFAQIGWR